MAKYIDRDALLEHLKKDPLFDLVERYGISGVIESFHAVDVRPVVRGRWIWQDAPCFGNPYGSYKCECGCLMPHKTNFCPNCGAEMREGS